MKVLVKRLLRQYGYPPDKQVIATETVLKQAELFTEDWVKSTFESHSELSDKKDAQQIKGRIQIISAE